MKREKKYATSKRKTQGVHAAEYDGIRGSYQRRRTYLGSPNVDHLQAKKKSSPWSARRLSVQQSDGCLATNGRGSVCVLSMAPPLPSSPPSCRRGTTNLVYEPQLTQWSIKTGVLDITNTDLNGSDERVYMYLLSDFPIVRCTVITREKSVIYHGTALSARGCTLYSLVLCNVCCRLSSLVACVLLGPDFS